MSRDEAIVGHPGEAAAGIARARRPAATRTPPRATYRLQFHKGFTFDDARAILPYLARLGISHVYASPVFAARPGSTHGYDIVDHGRINPELGGEDGFLRFSDTLQANGLKLLLDIVPNHMGVGGADNPWWLSVLEWGELSPFATTFDIDWDRPGANRKLVVPFLGSRYGEALEGGDLKLAFDVEEGSFSVWHFEHRFPICPLDYPVVLDRAIVAAPKTSAAEMLAISERLRAMAEERRPERRASFPAEAENLKRRLAEAAGQTPGFKGAIDLAVALVNGTPGTADSVGTLHRLLEAQAYRLAHWRVASSDISYRRFFDIDGLAGLRVEDPAVFEAVHARLFALVRAGRVDGLRIDHIDGLADPAAYVQALRAALGPECYIVAEKILEPGEALRPWALDGTTGYDVLNLIDGLFVDSRNADAFERIYREHSKIEGRYGALLRRAKTGIIDHSFTSEFESLVLDLKRTADADRHTRDYTENVLRQALAEIVARFPVYRTYLNGDDPVEADKALVEHVIARVKQGSRLPDGSVHEFVGAVLLGDIGCEDPGGPDPGVIARFRRRFQQFTGPVMAKSLEDTLFYRYGRLIGLNEVGGDPSRFGVPVAEFHAANAARLAAWPDTMIATSTHDTKRGEDARARLAALSEEPALWQEALAQWTELTAPFVTDGEDGAEPDGNDRAILLQALLGAWPPELLYGETEPTAIVGFKARFEGFVLKALREAKRHTSWVNPNQTYETAARNLSRTLFEENSHILATFRQLAQRLHYLGMINGLSRTVLKCTLPGVPDIYQGTELWDFSLVDPDNRRPVDFAARAEALGDDTKLADLIARLDDGHLKQRVIADLLADRANSPRLYADGDYEPLTPRGPRSEHVVAFRRRLGDESLVVVVPRLVGGLLGGLSANISWPGEDGIWGATVLDLPFGAYSDLMSKRQMSGASVRLSELFTMLPFALLKARA